MLSTELFTPTKSHGPVWLRLTTLIRCPMAFAGRLLVNFALTMPLLPWALVTFPQITRVLLGLPPGVTVFLRMIQHTWVSSAPRAAGGSIKIKISLMIHSLTKKVHIWCVKISLLLLLLLSEGAVQLQKLFWCSLLKGETKYVIGCLSNITSSSLVRFWNRPVVVPRPVGS